MRSGHSHVVARRYANWPDQKSRGEAGRMLAEGASLATVLRRYPEGPIRTRKGKPIRPERRAICAHYALLQELQGEPDTDPDNVAVVERIIREEGLETARVRTGSALTKYRNEWPGLAWYRSQAPEGWFRDYEDLRLASRGGSASIP